MKKNIYSVIYKDEHLIIVNKTAGLLTVPDRWDGNAPNLAELLTKEICNNENAKIYTVHRLDKDTSGLIVYALTSEAHKILSLNFSNKNIKKIYHAFILGKPEKDNFFCDAPLLPDGDKMHRTIISAKNGKESFTEFTVLKRIGKFSLIEARPITGRTHQIRVHLKHAGFPILCDCLYGKGQAVYLSNLKNNWSGDRFTEKPLLNRLALHAYSLEFEHPIQNKTISLTAEYPKDFRSFLFQIEKLANG